MKQIDHLYLWLLNKHMIHSLLRFNPLDFANDQNCLKWLCSSFLHIFIHAGSFIWICFNIFCLFSLAVKCQPACRSVCFFIKHGLYFLVAFSAPVAFSVSSTGIVQQSKNTSYKIVDRRVQNAQTGWGKKLALWILLIPRYLNLILQLVKKSLIAHFNQSNFSSEKGKQVFCLICYCRFQCIWTWNF